MPHAALWVVQREGWTDTLQHAMFQCRTRLCGWCNSARGSQEGGTQCFNAARGFVGGATSRMMRSGCNQSSFNAARGFVGGATHELLLIMLQNNCFNAARGFVGGATKTRLLRALRSSCFNAARGCVGGAAPDSPSSQEILVVSMPHAALWVVQPKSSSSLRACGASFNAARGFVGGAAWQQKTRFS